MTEILKQTTPPELLGSIFRLEREINLAIKRDGFRPIILTGEDDVQIGACYKFQVANLQQDGTYLLHDICQTYMNTGDDVPYYSVDMGLPGPVTWIGGGASSNVEVHPLDGGVYARAVDIATVDRVADLISYKSTVDPTRQRIVYDKAMGREVIAPRRQNPVTRMLGRWGVAAQRTTHADEYIDSTDIR